MSPHSPKGPTTWPDGKAPATIDDFLVCLDAAGILSPAECQAFLDKLPAESRPATPKALAAELVKAGKITKFQSAGLLQGKLKYLLFGEYLVLDKIGQGGMGQVLKAEHRRMKRVVALKVMSGSEMQRPDAVRRFQREVQAAARLIHSNIVTAFDANEANGIHFLVMEFVDGQDLASIIHQRGALPADKAVDVVLQAARGLAYAHENGIIHRDIKPGNLLLDKRGTVKILDMGLARLSIGEGESGEELTNSGQVMGTVDYMAPEQALDTRHADARADIYSLGCTLYRLITGNLPYEGDTVVKKILAHREAPLPSLVGQASSLPGLDPIFRKMIAKRPDDRYQTMAEVVAELEGVRSQGSGARGQRSEGHSSPSSEVDPGLSNFLAGLSTGGKSGAAQATVRKAGTQTTGLEETIDTVAPTESTDSKLAALAGPAPATRSRLSHSSGAKRPHDYQRLYLLGTVAAGALSLAAVAAVLIWALSSGGRRAAGPKQPAAPPLIAGSKLIGVTNFALDFDGKSSYIEVVPFPIDVHKPFTVECFARPRDVRRTQGVLEIAGETPIVLLRQFDANDSGGYQWGVRHCGLNAGSLRMSPASVVFMDERVHLAAVFDGARLELFVNGQPAETTFDSPLPKPENARLIIGAMLENHLPASFFDGTLDEIRISKIARYKTKFGPPNRLPSDADTLALYHCDEGAGNELKDSSGNNRHGKVVGAKWTKVGRASQPAIVTSGVGESRDSERQKTEAERLGVPLTFNNGLGAMFMLIPRGRFVMGSPESEPGRDERYEMQREVVIPTHFYMASHEVTRGQYELLMGSLPKELQEAAGDRERPVTFVTWEDAEAFCRKLTEAEEKSTGRRYRLPTSEEWEYACRAGTQTEFYHGNRSDHLIEYAWISGNAQASPQPVGRKLPNAWGLCDMLGNVWEWAGPMPGGTFVHRGGSANNLPHQVRCAAVVPSDGNTRSGALGFRVVCELTRADTGENAAVPGQAEPTADAPALMFDGEGHRLELPAFLDKPEAFTIELWLLPRETAGSHNVFRTKVPDGGEALALSFYTKESPMFSIGHGSRWKSAVGQPATAAVWQHYACVYTDKELRLFQDGRLTGTAEVTEPLELAMRPLWIGDCGLPTNAFRGRVGEIRVSRGAAYSEDFEPVRPLPATPETLALYHLDEGAGLEAKDSSGNNRHAKITGAIWVNAKNGQPFSPPP
jgi:serine/threonine protein kinase/formylglycine-generating enzyme required for sulfatase activity